MAYNVETVLAEKFETIITRGVTNTRMRDFYDIYILTATQDVDATVFRAALKKTAEKRNTFSQLADVLEIIQMIASDAHMVSLWLRYQKKYRYAAEVTWEMAINALLQLAQMA